VAEHNIQDLRITANVAVTTGCSVLDVDAARAGHAVQTHQGGSVTYWIRLVMFWTPSAPSADRLRSGS
jgi:hypothetical protein